MKLEPNARTVWGDGVFVEGMNPYNLITFDDPPGNCLPLKDREREGAHDVTKMIVLSSVPVTNNLELGCTKIKNRPMRANKE